MTEKKWSAVAAIMLALATGAASLGDVSSGGAAPASAPATAPGATSASGWSGDIARSLTRATAEGKDLLVQFTASDASSDSGEAHLNDARFVAGTSSGFVLVRFDGRPGSEGSPLTRAMWAERLGVKSLPSIFLLDSTGRPYASVAGSVNAAPDDLVVKFVAMQDVRKRRDVAFTSAASLSGIEKAKMLAIGLAEVGEHAASGYLSVMEQIVSNDSENAAGLRARYLPVVSQAHIDSAIQSDVYPLLDHNQFQKAIDRISLLITQESPTPAQKQLLLAFQGQLYQNLGDRPRALQVLDQAIALDPESVTAHRVRTAKAQLLQTEPAPTP